MVHRPLLIIKIPWIGSLYHPLSIAPQRAENPRNFRRSVESPNALLFFQDDILAGFRPHYRQAGPICAICGAFAGGLCLVRPA